MYSCMWAASVVNQCTISRPWIPCSSIFVYKWFISLLCFTCALQDVKEQLGSSLASLDPNSLPPSPPPSPPPSSPSPPSSPPPSPPPSSPPHSPLSSHQAKEPVQQENSGHNTSDVGPERKKVSKSTGRLQQLNQTLQEEANCLAEKVFIFQTNTFAFRSNKHCWVA